MRAGPATGEAPISLAIYLFLGMAGASPAWADAYGGNPGRCVPPPDCSAACASSPPCQWTNPAMTPGSPIRAVDFDELRCYVDCARQNASPALPPYAWSSNMTSAAGRASIRAQDINDLRAAVSAVYPAASKPAWKNDPLVPGATPIRAEDISELRTYVQNVPAAVPTPTPTPAPTPSPTPTPAPTCIDLPDVAGRYAITSYCTRDYPYVHAAACVYQSPAGSPSSSALYWESQGGFQKIVPSGFPFKAVNPACSPGGYCYNGVEDVTAAVPPTVAGPPVDPYYMFDSIQCAWYGAYQSSPYAPNPLPPAYNIIVQGVRCCSAP